MSAAYQFRSVIQAAPARNVRRLWYLVLACGHPSAWMGDGRARPTPKTRRCRACEATHAARQRYSGAARELRDARLAAGWSQRAMAREFGISRAAICKYERGKSPIPRSIWAWVRRTRSA